MQYPQWEGFAPGEWQRSIDVRSFIQKNFTLYEGGGKFLAPATARTKAVWKKCEALLQQELEKGVLDVETKRFSGIDNFEPGYIDRDNEVIVGLQTDAPLKRIVNPYGGMRCAKASLEQYGYALDEEMEHTFSEYRKTHNEGVFDAYPARVRAARHAGLLTGLPDAYGRGRIIGDYRRVALYGIDALAEEKRRDLDALDGPMTEERIRLREEVSEQIRALGKIKAMAARYGVDISRPAKDAKEAVQFLYMAYLAGIKENNGAATSLGRTSTFLDIYIERDLARGAITEAEAQELIDQFVIKLRLVRHLRTPDYNELFGGDPTWVTESIGGISLDGKPLVTKTSFRILHTLTNLGTAPEPNLTVLWSEHLPHKFKRYCAKMSIATDSIQYENDDIMRPVYGDDYAIACCVSAMRVGKQMQFFGARCNLAKALLYAINGGVDEVKGGVIVPGIEPLAGEVLEYDKVRANYEKVLEYTAGLYADTMDIIHYMHDKYAYEAGQMALHDTNVERIMAFGVAGLSVAADSLSAIRWARVRPVRNAQGIAVDFVIEGDFPKYGNDDDRADDEAVYIVRKFSSELKKHPLYRNAMHTLSVLTITSNVKKDGRHAGRAQGGRGVRPRGKPHARARQPRRAGLAELGGKAALPRCVPGRRIQYLLHHPQGSGLG